MSDFNAIRPKSGGLPSSWSSEFFRPGNDPDIYLRLEDAQTGSQDLSGSAISVAAGSLAISIAKAATGVAVAAGLGSLTPSVSPQISNVKSGAITATYEQPVIIATYVQPTLTATYTVPTIEAEI